MEFRQIRYALAVAKDRSFTKAAERLNISQSAVSEQVKLLEAQIGFELFRRTGRGIESTERGRMFLYEAERVATDLLSLTDIARRLSGVGVEAIMFGYRVGTCSDPATTDVSTEQHSVEPASRNQDRSDQSHFR